jgi:thiol-disulfide isomerase/thioredoxin
MKDLLMKYMLAIIGLGFVICALGLQSVFGKDAPTSESQLLQELNAALKVKDKDAILALFNWEGVSTPTQSYYSDAISDLLEQDVKNVTLSPLPKCFRPAFEENGFRYSANVSVVGIVNVKLGYESLLSYGRKGKAFYLAGLSKENISSTNSPPAATQKLTIQVLNIDGKPLTNAIIICADPDKIPQLGKTALMGGRESFQTDNQGFLFLTLTSPNLFLVAANDQGFGWLPNRDLANHAVLAMQPWGRIEGVRKNRNHVVPDEHLSLSLDRDYYGEYVMAPVLYYGHETVTDAKGRFAFTDVPPLKYFIDRQEKQRAYWGYFGSVEVEPGQTKKLEIDTRGRTVTGRVTVAPGLDTNIDLAACSGELMSRMKYREGSRRSVGFPVSADGSFRADRVEPGDYTISGDIRRDNRLVALLDPISVHVPDDTSDAEDVPFDMGTVTLKGAVNFMQGDTAPDFSCLTLDDKPLKLSTFRGKYVLLDFWATWCGPCVAETPNLKATYDEFGKDGRFVMISLSLDSDQAAPRKFARNEGIAWTQGFLGDWSKDKTTQIYGVYGIPAIFLIGPDGKVLATDLRGTKIKEAVSTALDK